MPEPYSATPDVAGFYDPRTSSVQYVVSDPRTRRCAIIDPVLDYDEAAGSVSTESADVLLAHVQANSLVVEWILDTHPHADHLSAVAYLKDRTGAPTGIGRNVGKVQALWKELYNLPDSFPTDGSQWDRLFDDGDAFHIGGLRASVLFSPGHTMASVTYLVGDAAFVHDTLFMPDGGTARADFPGGDAWRLWDSIQRILALPASTRLFTGHDYRPGGRPAEWESTVAQQRATNVHSLAAPTGDAFVAMRTERDARLPMPKLILHALQVNIAGGRLPEPDDNGRRYLRIPLGALARPQGQ